MIGLIGCTRGCFSLVLWPLFHAHETLDDLTYTPLAKQPVRQTQALALCKRTLLCGCVYVKEAERNRSKGALAKNVLQLEWSLSSGLACVTCFFAWMLLIKESSVLVTDRCLLSLLLWDLFD